MSSSNFVDFTHCASRICLGQNVNSLVWRWRQICPLKTNIFTLNVPILTNEVSLFKFAIEVCFENHFGLIHALFLSLGSTKCVYFFGTPARWENDGGFFILNEKSGIRSFLYIQSNPLQYILLNYTTYKILYPTTDIIPFGAKNYD